MRAMTLLGVALAVLGAAAPLDAQSLFASRGLGVPVTAVDARARALGGIGVGLFEFNPGFVNPAEVAGVTRRGIVAVMQPTSRTLEVDGERETIDATRFPMLRLMYPVGSRTVVSAGYGGFLDQSWAVTTEGTQTIGEQVVPTRDVLNSTGGVAQLQVGVAYTLTDALAIGGAAGIYTGRLRHEVVRSFPEVVDEQFLPFTSVSEWDYRAPMVSAGFRWDPAELLRLAGSVTWAGDLQVTADNGEERQIQLPLQLAAGASGYLTSTLVGTLSGRWSGWGGSGDEFEQGAADGWEVGGGLEWRGMTTADRVFPVRIGHHRAALPFLFDGEQPREQATAFGLGARFGGTPAAPLARLDGAVERGSRGDAAALGLTERFWRATISLSLFGL